MSCGWPVSSAWRISFEADPRRRLQHLAGSLVLGAETALAEDLDLERVGLDELQDEALLGIEPGDRVCEALAQRRADVSGPDERRECRRQGVQEPPLVATPPQVLVEVDRSLSSAVFRTGRIR